MISQNVSFYSDLSFPRSSIVQPDVLTQNIRKMAKEVRCPSSFRDCVPLNPERLFVKKVNYPPAEAFVELQNGDYAIRLGPLVSRALEGAPSLFTKEEAEGIVMHELSHIALGHVDRPSLFKVPFREFEADRNTLQKPHLARGLRNALNRLIVAFGDKWEEIQAAGDYPRFSARIARLDYELCKLPENQDAQAFRKDPKAIWLHAVC